MIFALIGNPNSGKTTLFNLLTDSNQHVGNFPGVTVEKKSGMIKNTNNCYIVDLPGIYSLRPYSKEEIITRNFLTNQKPDGIINIVDASNIERNLYLSLQLLELNIPMIIILNMMDEVKNNGGIIDIFNLSRELNIPIIPISALKNEGIHELIYTIKNFNKSKIYKHTSIYSTNSHISQCIDSISSIINNRAIKLGISPCFCAIKLIEEDKIIEKQLKLKSDEIKLIKNIIYEMEEKTRLNKNISIANIRYNFIEKICKKSVIKPKESKEHKKSKNIDKILTNKYLGLPIFFLIMGTIFFLTFNVFGKILSYWLELGINYLTLYTDLLLTKYNINPTLHSLVIDGIFTGVGSILSFLPLIVVLFFFLSILEDTGYMSRITFILDELLKKLGLSGKSFVPMLIGFGCSVPAIMATRTLSNERDRKITLLLVPYMSCSAKLPIYLIFCDAFFNEYSAIVMMGLYIVGIIIGLVIALLLKNITLTKKSTLFLMELPNYRMPSLKNIALLIWDKSKEFIEKAFSIILIGTILIWFLNNFDLNLNIVTDNSTSLLAEISNFITPIFKPLGFGNWKSISALISGLTAKESVISTLSILLNAKISELNYILPTIFTPLTALCFLIFTLLYTPCIATVSTIYKELNSAFQTILIVIFQLAVAWLITFIFFKIGSFIL